MIKKIISRKTCPSRFIVLACLSLVGIPAMAAVTTNAEPAGTLYALECNHLTRPLGMDDPMPFFSWKWRNGSDIQQKSQEENSGETYFRVEVDTDSLSLVRGTGKIWHSGYLPIEQPFLQYKGQKLHPFTKYYWKIVCTTDTVNGTGLNRRAISSFETGLQSIHNWKGAWISDEHPTGFKPAGYFRKEFAVPKSIKSARIYIAAGGLYKLMVNGQRIGDRELDPVYTRFDRHLYYTTYDATTQLKSGGNAIGVIMGNGWYNLQSTAVWDFDKAPWRGRPTFCLDLRIEYTDGTVETISSGKDWTTRTGAIVFNSIYTAEHQDNRLLMPGWADAHLNDKDWHSKNDTLWRSVILRSAPAKIIEAASLVPIRKSAPIRTVNFKKFSDTDYVFDIGQNIAGISEIKVKGERGTVLRVKHGERLYKNGHVDLSNIDVHYRPTDDSDPFQTDIYTLSGNGVETFRPWFNYKGFQYVEITSSQPIELEKSDLVAYFMHSDVPPVGYIHSADTIINKIWAATNKSYLSNLFGYPTDCPQREKNGWTGDAQINIETGLYNFDGITVYNKWLQDHLDEQQPNGVFPSIIPSNGWGYEWGNGPDWTSTIAIIPWNLYLFYGDSRLMETCYTALKRYVDHITEISPSGICSWGLGDWVPVKSKTPVPFTSTIYYYTDVTILAKAAKLFANESDYQQYTQLAEKIKTVFNETYLNKITGMYGEGFQTELSAPLFWGLVPEESIDQVAKNLNERVVRDGFHLDVGLLGSKTILGALSNNGYANTAYRLAAQRSYPSWGWWMVNGATTLYENWDIASARDISLNHIMFGEIGAWLYKGLGGIYPDPAAPGFKNVQLRPNFPDGLAHFEARHTGPYGEIIVDWQKIDKKGKATDKVLNADKEKRVRLDVTIPSHSTATLQLPEGYQLVDLSGNKSSKANFQQGQGKTVGQKGIQAELQAGNYKFFLKSN